MYGLRELGLGMDTSGLGQQAIGNKSVPGMSMLPRITTILIIATYM